MSISIYQISIPVIVRALGNLSKLLHTGEAYVTENKLPANTLLEARLAADMFPLTRQVQIASDTAKGIGARLAGIENPSYADTEQSFEELQARIQKTIDFLNSIDEESFSVAETREVSIKLRGNDVKFTGQDYLLYFALPNFYFHITTAYDILRNQGVSIGKSDFLGSLSTK